MLSKKPTLYQGVIAKLRRRAWKYEMIRRKLPYDTDLQEGESKESKQFKKRIALKIKAMPYETSGFSDGAQEIFLKTEPVAAPSTLDFAACEAAAVFLGTRGF